jgi:hypothetical protein
MWRELNKDIEKLYELIAIMSTHKGQPKTKGMVESLLMENSECFTVHIVLRGQGS